MLETAIYLLLLRVLTGGMHDQLNQLATTCGKVADNIIRTPVVNDVRATSGDDRAMNVVISGIAEDKSSSVWRDVLSRVLYTAAAKDIVIKDAFRLGRDVADKRRPLLVKLHSAWDRRLVLGGARTLNEVMNLSGVFTSQPMNRWKHVVEPH